jgi:hypothetical protein
MYFDTALAEEIWSAKYRFSSAVGGGGDDAGAG